MKSGCVFWLPGRSILLSFVCWILMVVANEPRITAYPIGLPNDQSAAVTEALQASFGSVVEAVTGFTPFYLTGDFNGDRMQDIVVVVLIKERRTALSKDVRLINPFWDSPKVTFPTNPAAEKKLALAIIHSWKTPKTAKKFLLVGRAALLTFVYDRASDPEGSKGLMKLMNKREKRPRSFAATAKGDLILLWTEVGDETPLYWNGRTYKWEEGLPD